MDALGALGQTALSTMKPSIKQATFFAITTLVLVSASVFAPAQSSKKAAPVSYKKVQAIFNKNCILCHSAPAPRAMMNLQSYAGVMKGNDDGSVITAGHPEKSLLYQLISTTGKKQMPPKRSLSKADIATVASWIKAGAKNK